jgi:2-dehydropantoate 2-reductase
VRRDDLAELLAEVTAVARAEGAATTAESVLAFVESVPEGMESSMQKDAAAGRPLELDAIGGAVLRAAERHGIETPAMARLVAEVAQRQPA